MPPPAPFECTGLPLPDPGVSATSTNGYGYYQRSDDRQSLSEQHPSPMSSSVTMSAYLRPGGGAQMPTAARSQALRAVSRHRLIVQTPDVYPNHNTLRIIVRCFDEFNNAWVSPAPSITVEGSLSGQAALLHSSFAPSTHERSYMYSATVHSSWFGPDDGGVRSARVSTTLSGAGTQEQSFSVHARPSWWSSRLSSAGIAAYITSDAAGTIPASHFRTGDFFYLHFFVHTGAYSMTSFSVQFEENPSVCHAVPASGSWSGSFTGGVVAQLDGAYAGELANRYEDSSAPGTYFVKYDRITISGSAITTTHEQVGYVKMKMVSAGTCLNSAVIKAFYHGTGTDIPGGEPDTPITIHGNTISAISDGPIALVGEVSNGMPLLNTAQYTGSPVSATIRQLVFSSPSGNPTSTTTTYEIATTQGTDTATTILANSLSDLVHISVRLLPAPTVVVTDDQLEQIESSGIYQRSRVSAVVGSFDVTHVANLGTTNAAILDLDLSGPYPTVGGVAEGTASVFVRDVSFASKSVSVVSSSVLVTSLTAYVVTSVEWSASSGFGPFIPVARQVFASEDAVGWVYQSATFSDSTSEWLNVALSVSADAPLNASIGLTAQSASSPPRVDVLFGAVSVCGPLVVSSVLGTALATVNVTMPPPTSMQVLRGVATLCPDGNGAEEFGRDHQTWVKARVSFADGTSKDMELDSRVSFDVSGGCGSVSSGMLSIVSSCRQSTVTVSASATLGAHTVSSSVSVSVVWLSSVRLQLYYRDGTTEYSRSQLYRRYDAACDSITPAAFHRLILKTFGTLTSGGGESVITRIQYSASGGGSISSQSGYHWLDVSSAGSVTIGVQPQPNPEATVASQNVSLSAHATADGYTFGWNAHLWTQDTLRTTYNAQHATTTTLEYSDYTEYMSNADKQLLVTYASTDTATISVSSTGQLQALQNSVATLDLSATFCTQSATTVSYSGVVSNLYRNDPADFDLGAEYGLPITYTAGSSSTVCIPIRFHSQYVIHQFQFTLFFTSSVLSCSSTACGTFSAGADW
jgi:hypothetical protein